MPAPPPGAIERPRVLAALDEAASRPLTLVAAPAGAGKTAAVGSWVEAGRAPGPVAWLSLDASDADPRRFWRGALSALARAGGAGRLASLPALVESLAGRDQPLVLVLDDYHDLDGVVDADLERLLRFPVGALRVVILTRADPQLGLARLRLLGHLAEIRADALAFTVGEARELLAALDVSLRAEDLARLWQRTEGWAAALRLAALSLKDHPDPGRFIESFAGTDATVSDYLISEVLARQPPELRDFLLRSSIVEALNADLADALTGDAEGHRLLSRLAHGDALIAPADEHGVWYRYHPLFAELLRAELRWEMPDALAELHRRAAVWLAAHDAATPAVRHAAQAGAWDLAAELVCDRWLHMAIDGELDALETVLDGMPQARVEECPELALALGGLLLTRRDDAGADAYLRLADERRDRVPARRRERFALAMATTRLYEARLRGNLATALQAARGLLAGHPVFEANLVAAELRSLALLNLGIVELWTGDLGAAVGHLERARAAAVETRRDWLALQAGAHLALAVGFRGAIGRSERCAREALALAERRGWTRTWPAGAALSALAAVSLQRCDLDEAERLVALAGRALSDAPDLPLRTTHALNRAQLLADRGILDAALDVLRAARDELADWPAAPALRDTLTAEECLLRAALGERDAALRALERRAGDDPASTVLRIALARLQLQAGEAQATLATLAPALADPDGALLSTRTEAWLLDALALDALADHDAAADALERALDLAEPAGLRRAILTHGPLVAPLLNRQRRRGTDHPVLVGEALEALGRRGQRRPAPLSLAEPLSEREETILRFLPTMMSNQEIAGELFVSVNTVKTHLKAIYRKLDVPGRRDAVTRARAGGLLP